MRRLIGALIMGSLPAFGMAGFNGTETRHARAGDAQPDISECMSFRNEAKEKSIVVRAKNECQRKLSCSLSYSVSCEDNHGKAHLQQRQERTLCARLGRLDRARIVGGAVQARVDD